MLRSRIYRRVRFQPLTMREVLTVLPGYHPLYANADPELLSLIDEHFAHGNWRNWAAFTHTAVALTAPGAGLLEWLTQSRWRPERFLAAAGPPPEPHQGKANQTAVRRGGPAAH